MKGPKLWIAILQILTFLILASSYNFGSQKNPLPSRQSQLLSSPKSAPIELLTKRKLEGEKQVQWEAGKSWGTGTLIGSIGLLAGGTIGGGFLGLPFYTTQLGFAKSTFLLISVWVFMNIQGFVFIDLCLSNMKRKNVTDTSIYTVAVESLGPKMASFLSVCFYFLVNACLVSQVAKAGDILNAKFPIPTSVGSVLMSITVAFIVFVGKGRIVEVISSVFTSGLLASFGFLMLKGLPLMKVENLTTKTANSGVYRLLLTFPILLQLIRAHDMIPTLCTNLAGDSQKIKITMVAGSFIPLLMMLGWNSIACGIVGPGSAIDPLTVLLQSPSVGSVVSMLGFSAILTTLIGQYLAMEQFLWDIVSSRKISKPHPQMTGNPKGFGKIAVRTGVYAMTVIPSLLVALSGPQAFYAAVEFAGVYPGTILFLILPPIMALVNQKKFKSSKRMDMKKLLFLAIFSMVPMGLTMKEHLVQFLSKC